jgi:hypothetical protein
MNLSLEKSFPRLWSIESGIAMVVTDLHGDWEAYERYRDCFVGLQARGQADCLIFTGDLIHSEIPETDKSLEIVFDVLALQATYGSAVIYLCGNHEMPHIYGITLAREHRDYTPDFEKALSQSQYRAEVMALFDSLPFYIRTKAGVSITHAGASAATAEPANALKLFHWSHQELLARVNKVLAAEDVAALRAGYSNLNHISYEALAKYYLAVSGPDDPRYDDLLRGFIIGGYPTFNQSLWPALFTRCEKEYSLADYGIFLDALLKELSVGFFPQQLLVAGHINIKGGHEIIARRHLRLASAGHAIPRQAGQYLLFDTGQPIRDIKNLLRGLGSVYHQGLEINL